MAPWRVARMVLLLWGVGTALLTVLYGLHDTDFIPRFLFAVSFPGVLVATGSARSGTSLVRATRIFPFIRPESRPVRRSGTRRW